MKYILNFENEIKVGTRMRQL